MRPRRPGMTRRVNAALRGNVPKPRAGNLAKLRTLADFVGKGQTPLEVLLEYTRTPEPKPRRRELDADFKVRWATWKEDRIRCASLAAPFVHPKLSAITHDGTGAPDEMQVTVTLVNADGRVAGTIAPPVISIEDHHAPLDEMSDAPD